MTTTCSPIVDYSYNTTIPVEGETLDSERFMYNFTRYYMRLAVKVVESSLTAFPISDCSFFCAG